jgi:site-specific DNA-methyltransferase (adenine-specific)
MEEGDVANSQSQEINSASCPGGSDANPPREIKVNQTTIFLEVSDLVEGMRKLATASVDVVVTSPPYNIGIEYSEYSDHLPIEEYLSWTAAWASEVGRVLKHDGSFFLNLGGASFNRTLPFKVVLEVEKAGLILQNAIDWVKSISVEEPDGTRVTVGPYKPINSSCFLSVCQEHVFHFSITGRTPLDKKAIGIPYKDKSNIERFEVGADCRCRGNTWFVRYPTNYNQGLVHPAQFPVELPEMCILLHGKHRARVVLDPFVGGGSSALAAIRCGVEEFIGYDVSPTYIKMAQKRITTDYAQAELF